MVTGHARNGSARGARSRRTEVLGNRAKRIKEKTIEDSTTQLPQSWETVLAEKKIGAVYKSTVESIMRAIVEATNKWAETVAKMGETASVELPTSERLKQFFALNPFGCRNKKMIGLLSILLKVPEIELTPANMIGENIGDGSPDDKELGFLAFADAGTAIKVIGGTPSLRRNQIRSALGDIIFICPDSEARVIRSDRDTSTIYLSELLARLAPMPEHYRAAAPEEILPVITRLNFDELHSFALNVLSRKVRDAFFAIEEISIEDEDI